MNQPVSKFFAPALLSLVAAAALVACGGGGSSGGAVAPVTPTADAVTTASAATATSIGATVIAGASSDEEVYNLAADVGDSWQLVLNNKTNMYVVKVLSTQYGLNSTTAAAFTKTTVGTTTTVKDASGSALSVQIDTRTKTVAGNATVGGKAASVAGSGYVIADVGKLAGNYFFAGSTRNVTNGQWRDTPLGGFIIAANGTDITVCDGSVAVNGVCTAVSASSPTISSKQLKIVQAGGIIRIMDGTKDFGILNVSAGDRGPVLIVDRFGLNNDTPAVLRAGVFYGAKSAKLAGNEFDGNWTCSNAGSDLASLVVSGTSYSVSVNKTTQQGTLQYNKVYVGSSNSAVDLNGVMIAKNNNEGLSDASLVLPLSSSLAIVVDNPATDSTQTGTDKNINVCRKN
ncbi:MAG: hypothetical protein ABIP46_05645 [Polaromonas sp.]